jgi:acrylyl-CoA reductase (NADPH)
MSFPALIVEPNPDGSAAPARICELERPEELPAPGGDVLVRVAYSSLNYKDGLALTGQGKILRQLPIVPGVDLAGTVAHPGNAARFRVGDPVVLTGWGVGEKYSGGFAGYARVNGDWLVPLPAGLTLRQAMAIGTAGFTAMQCVLALEDHGINPGPANEIIVSGAAGGVGSLAVALLAGRGFRVVASTGRIETEGDYLRHLGAAEIIPRSVLAAAAGRPLDSARWAGGVDTVGGETLASILRQTREYGSVAACGLAGGANLPITVLPFILRGVNLLGIHSVMCPRPLRERIWQRLAAELDGDRLEAMARVVTLKEVLSLGPDILAGKIRGRVVVAVNS